MPSYRLSDSIAGVEQSSTGMHIVQIAAGEVIRFPEIERESGLVNLVFHGRNVTAFAQDLRLRSNRIDEIAQLRDGDGMFDPNASA
jgi:hypothetical protein